MTAFYKFKMSEKKFSSFSVEKVFYNFPQFCFQKICAPIVPPALTYMLQFLSDHLLFQS